MEAKVKVKLSIDRSGQALGLQEFEAPTISRQSAHDGGKVFSPKRRPHLRSGDTPWYSFLLEAE